MKRQLIFLYRYFTTSRRWRRWINTQTVLVLVVTVVFLGALMITAPFAKTERPIGPIGTTLTAQAANTSTASAAGFTEGTAVPGIAALDQVQLTPQAGTPGSPIPELLATSTPTPLAPEYYQTDPQTIGMSLGAVVLVLIVVIGFFSFFKRKEE